MAQGLGTLAENIKKREEAQKAAEGKPPAPVIPVAAKPKKATPTPPTAAPAKPYVPIAEKTPEQKEALRKEMEAELAVRKRNSGEK